MIILDYNKSRHKEIIHACVEALKQGKVIAYPTDTSYGLAVDATNLKAVKKLYIVKGRSFKKAISVVVPSLAYVKKLIKLGTVSSTFVKKFWPGAFTLVGELKVKSENFKILSAGTKFLGLRMPNNKIALDLSATLKKPITATSANVAGQPDCYSAEEINKQYKNQKRKPDIIINFGKLFKQKPSTIVKVENNLIQIIRQGPITEKQLNKVLKNTK